ncbi:MAG: anhydro-N-acetylmuramic acid kinase [Gammaproteobacteria bacterium]|nr:MAG: anhydro-N-acetylmuramic acid kinase [Gammaproteobacteria bacterium]
MSLYIGVMSGTSLDGIDIAIVDVTNNNKCQLIAAQTFPFPTALHDKLLALITSQQCALKELGEVDVELGQITAQAINHLLTKHQLDANNISAIGSHGQTLFHAPNSDYPFSMQIGNGNVIAEQTGITTVADFRQRDIAAGGQGAPLVPAFHSELFADDHEDRVIVNIGGISNLTLLPANKDQAVTGFDTGPGNVLLNGWIQRHQQQTYDNQGQWAASGQCNDELLTSLLDEPYFQQAIPKSTGRELFNLNWLDNKLIEFNENISATDIQATLVQLTAHSIANEIKCYLDSSKTIFICGGGAHNDYLINQIQNLLGDKKVSTTDELGLHPDWVEACAFAWLAYKTLNKQSGNMPTVTGASHPVILGAIYYASSEVS